MSIMTPADRLRGALWGMFVGDALAMPAHWYYDVAALHRDFGTIRDYQAPKDFHPNSINILPPIHPPERSRHAAREAAPEARDLPLLMATRSRDRIPPRPNR